jgi:hypothetical protein
MQSIEPENNDEVSKSANAYAKYSAVVFQMIAIIGGFAFAGYKIDAWLKHDVQWVTALLCLAGVCLSIYVTIKQLTK